MISKNQVWTLFILSFLLVSCSSKVEDRNELVNNANFDIPQVSAINASFTASTTGWKDIPLSNQITFKACFLEKGTVQTIVGEKFSITTNLGRIQPDPTTDITGCLTWSETFQLSYLAKERYLKHIVHFKGLGLKKGTAQRSLALNLWSDVNSQAVKDLKYQKNLPYLAGEIAQQNTFHETQNILQVQDIAVVNTKSQPEADSAGNRYLYNYSFTPGFIRQQLNGVFTKFQSFTQGEFNIHVLAVEKDFQGKISELSRSKFSAPVNAQNKLTGTFDLVTTKQIDADSRVYFIFKFVPIQGPLNLNPSEGFVLMDFLEGQKSSQLQDLSQLTDLSFQQYAEKLQEITKSISIAQAGQKVKNVGFNILPLNISVGSIVDNGSYNKSSNKLIYTRLKICLTDAASKHGAASVKNESLFKISGFDEKGAADSEQERVYPTFNGCIDKAHLITTYNIYDAEHWIPMTLKVEGVSGRYQGLSKTRRICINPWTGSADYGFDLGSSGQKCPTIHNPKKPKIHLTRVGYQYLRMDSGSFTIDKYLHMAHKRIFQIQLEPKLSLRFRSKANDSSLPAITFGDFKVRLAIYVPKHGDVNFDNVDLNDFTLLTASEKVMTAKESGLIHSEISLPFTVLDVQRLPFRNLLVVDISPNNKEPFLKGTSVSLPFYGLTNTMKTPVAKTLLQHSADFNKTAAQERILSYQETPLRGISKKLSAQNLTAVELYRKSIKTIYDNKYPGINYLHTNYATLNKIPMAGGKKFIQSHQVRDIQGYRQDRTVEEYSNISSDEFKRVLRLGKDVGRDVLNKFCRHLFNSPTLKWSFRRGKTIATGQEFANCYADPQALLEVLPMTHIEEIYPLNPRAAGDHTINNAKYISSRPAEVSRGNAFFAGQGDRYAKNEGKRLQQYWSFTLGATAHPPPFIFGGGLHYGEERIVYKGKINSHLEMNLDRSYTQLNTARLIVDRLELLFKAETIKCVSISVKSSHHRHLHICEEEHKRRKMREHWYFIGEDLSQKNSFLSNGNDVNNASLLQIIRGKAIFLQQWGKWETEDTLLMVNKIDKKIAIGDGFEKIAKDGIINLPYQGYSDNAFPSMMISTPQP